MLRRPRGVQHSLEWRAAGQACLRSGDNFPPAGGEPLSVRKVREYVMRARFDPHRLRSWSDTKHQNDVGPIFFQQHRQFAIDRVIARWENMTDQPYA